MSNGRGATHPGGMKGARLVAETAVVEGGTPVLRLLRTVGDTPSGDTPGAAVEGVGSKETGTLLRIVVDTRSDTPGAAVEGAKSKETGTLL